MYILNKKTQISTMGPFKKFLMYLELEVVYFQSSEEPTKTLINILSYYRGYLKNHCHCLIILAF